MPAVVVAAVLAVLYLIVDPPSADLAAALYRADLFHHSGLLAWDNGWYGGHHLPGYSLVFPPLGALLGVRLVGALSIVAAAAAAVPLGRRLVAPPAALAATIWFSVAVAAAVVSGRLPFALGVALGTTGLWLAARQHTVGAGVLGVATALASPVAGLFVALLAGATWWGLRDRALLAVAVTPLAAAAVMTTAFPEGGVEPFVASAFVPAVAAVVLGLAIAPRGPVRLGLLVYGAVLIVAAAIPSPLGGNAARLGALVSGPLAIGLLWNRRALLAAAVVPLAYWVLYPPVRDWATASGDPARAASYYSPLLAELARQGGPPGRLEIPFTRNHWEAYRVAATVPLARGWERQLDRRYNAVFYEGKLTPARYGRWLAENAVRWVALPDAPLDPSARTEARLIRTGLPYLRPLWSSAHWRLFAVAHPAALGATRLGVDDFTTPGGLVRVHWTPYWAIESGRGCVRKGPGGWTDVTPSAPGASVRVGIAFDPLRALSDSPRCR